MTPSEELKWNTHTHTRAHTQNSLPDSLRDPAVGLDQFRRDLKTHLFE